MSEKKKKILVCVDWFDPGFKAGGPIRSAVNFVSYLKDDFDIFVFTSDRDLGDSRPYPGMETDLWINMSGYHIFYASPSFLSWKTILGLVKDVGPDYLYLNSMFSRYFSLYPLLMHKFRDKRSGIVLAPRGMLKGSALSHKSLKKSIFLRLIKLIGITKDITFHATDTQEESDIVGIFGLDAKVIREANLPGSQEAIELPSGKSQGSLKLLFVGRLHPIKNLDLLLSVLLECRKRVVLTIIAPVEDDKYWQKCKHIINSLPWNVQVVHLENIPHKEIRRIILDNHIFVLPTKGENFGHAIFESLAAGRPVLISDQTPWRNLELNKAGWDISLNDREKFSKVIDMAVDMDEAELAEWCTGAWNFCNNFLISTDLKKGYKRLFI